MEPPAYQDLKQELGEIRRVGITRLRSLDLPALTQAARAAGLLADNRSGEAPVWEMTIREALDELSPSRFADVGGLLFGLEPGTRAYEPHQLRIDAAERWGVSLERFRRDPQDTVISEISEAILRRCVAHQQRLARIEMDRRLPTSSRIAVQWLERFDSYHRIWTPTFALAADLTAYRHTMLEPDRPYDNLDGERPDLPEGYTQERQAEGYVTFALFRYTQYLVEVEAFKRRFGGQWLLSDSQAEREASDAIHQIAVESPNNERDDSYLRDLHRRTGGELHPFLLTLADEQIGRETHHEWQDWAAACGCAWDTDPPSDPRLFPTARTSPGIRSDCPLHAIVMAGSAYCIIVDEDWMRIADWYRSDPITRGSHPGHMRPG